LATPAKPPVLPSATPPKVAGASPTSATSKPKYPQDLGNGDVLIDEISSITVKGVVINSGQHLVKIIKRTDSTQRFPYLVDCPCGSQGRMHTEADARSHAANHIAIRKSRGA
jgi:hypothetical protein